uniref:Metalloendopeptidase n=1 Tax=Parastrongyloides trichosuri TaxID=131310 RepID=A0A0N4Z8H2_PARTI
MPYCCDKKYRLYDNDEKVIEKRAIYRIDPAKRFKLPIKFFIDKRFKNSAVPVSLQFLDRYTCLRFNKQKKEFEGQGIIFMKGNVSKIEQVGAKSNEPTYVYLTDKCNLQKGCVMNLIGSLFGLFPELFRHDRDDYIELLRENMKPGGMKYFKTNKLKDIWIYNTGFDYGSIMNPSNTIMSANKEPTFKSKLSKFYDEMVGQRYYFSFNDIKHLNDFYCGHVCKKKVRGCTNGGYPDPKNCKKCRCPRGYAGKYCTGLEGSSGDCGERRHIARRYLQDIVVNGTQECYFFINSPRNTKIRIIVKESNTKKAKPCFENMGLEIKNRHNKGAIGLCLCGQIKKYALNPYTNRIMIHYKGTSPKDYIYLRYQIVRDASEAIPTSD